jgi:hypothetical protein
LIVPLEGDRLRREAAHDTSRASGARKRRLALPSGATSGDLTGWPPNGPGCGAAAHALAERQGLVDHTLGARDEADLLPVLRFDAKRGPRALARVPVSH